MSIKDYKKQFEETYHNYDVSDWESAYFLKFNDDTQAQNPGDNTNWCGRECTKHTLTLTSAVDQDVWITGHTWDARCMAETCQKWN